MSNESWKREQKYKKVSRWLIYTLSLPLLFWLSPYSMEEDLFILLGTIGVFVFSGIISILFIWVFSDLEFADKTDYDEDES